MELAMAYVGDEPTLQGMLRLVGGSLLYLLHLGNNCRNAFQGGLDI